MQLDSRLAQYINLFQGVEEREGGCYTIVKSSRIKYIPKQLDSTSSIVVDMVLLDEESPARRS